MENLELTLIILASIFLGAALPALLVLTSILVSVRRRITKNATRFDDMFERLHLTATRLEATSRGLEGSEANVVRLSRAVGSLADWLEQTEKSIKKAAAFGNIIGPAVAAFVQGLREQGASAAAATPVQQQQREEGEHHE